MRFLEKYKICGRNFKRDHFCDEGEPIKICLVILEDFFSEEKSKSIDYRGSYSFSIMVKDKIQEKGGN
jgi:hypothetical protein